jgi:hypothetical protein
LEARADTGAKKPRAIGIGFDRRYLLRLQTRFGISRSLQQEARALGYATGVAIKFKRRNPPPWAASISEFKPCPRDLVRSLVEDAAAASAS